MVEIDITWRNPSAEQRQCLDWILHRGKAKRGKRRGWRGSVTELQLAEGVLMAYEGGMLWTVQAEHWQAQAPKFYGIQLPWTFSAAAGLIAACVKRGPHTDGAWWTLAWLPKESQWRAIFLLCEFGFKLWAVQDRPPASAMELLSLSMHQDGQPIISRWFEIFLDLVLGRGWEGRYSAFMARQGHPLHPAFAKQRQRDLSTAPYMG